MKHSSAIEWLGWIGVVLITGAYGALSFGWIAADYAFQVPTLLGSLAVAIEAWVKHDKQPAILNLIFATIAAIAIVRLVVSH